MSIRISAFIAAAIFAVAVAVVVAVAGLASAQCANKCGQWNCPYSASGKSAYWAGFGGADAALAYWQALGRENTRPFVTDLSFTRKGAATVSVWANLASPAASPPTDWESTSGRLFLNIESQGLYNRKGAETMRLIFNLGCTKGGGISVDFSDTQYGGPTNPLCNIDAETLVEAKIKLGPVYSGRTLWTWQVGHTVWWQITGPQNDQTLHFKAYPRNSPSSWRPGVTPKILPSPGLVDDEYTGTCIADRCDSPWPENCDAKYTRNVGLHLRMTTAIEGVNNAEGETDVKGALFTTDNVWNAACRVDKSTGKLFKGATVLYRLVGPHFREDGKTLMRGSMVAYLPREAVVRAFPAAEKISLAAVSKKLNISRAEAGEGDEDRVVTDYVKESEFGTEMVRLNVTNAHFSTPTFEVADPFAPEWCFVDGDCASTVGVIIVIIAVPVLALVALSWYCFCRTPPAPSPVAAAGEPKTVEAA